MEGHLSSSDLANPPLSLPNSLSPPSSLVSLLEAWVFKWKDDGNLNVKEPSNESFNLFQKSQNDTHCSQGLQTMFKNRILIPSVFIEKLHVEK